MARAPFSQAIPKPQWRGSDPSSGQESRRLRLLKRIGLFGTDTKGARIKRATQPQELIKAYELVHDTFVEQGYIHPQPGGLRVRAFEAMPGTATFMAAQELDVVGVQTLVVDSPGLGLPSDLAFRDAIDRLRAAGGLVCEATNEAVLKEYRRSAVPTELMRCMFAHALTIGCTDLVTTISPGHAAFYEFIGFRQVSEVRSYSDEIEDPTVVVAWDLREIRRRFEAAEAKGDSDQAFLKVFCFEGSPYWDELEAWDQQARQTFQLAGFIGKLLAGKGDALTLAGHGV